MLVFYFVFLNLFTFFLFAEDEKRNVAHSGAYAAFVCIIRRICRRACRNVSVPT